MFLAGMLTHFHFLFISLKFKYETWVLLKFMHTHSSISSFLWKLHASISYDLNALKFYTFLPALCILIYPLFELSIPLKFLQRLIEAFATLLESCPHLGFILQWCQVYLWALINWILHPFTWYLIVIRSVQKLCHE